VTAVVIAVLVAPVLLGLAWLGWQVWRSSRPSWAPLPGRPGQWASTEAICPVSPERIAAALGEAEWALMHHSRIPVARIIEAGSRAQVYVHGSPEWLDAWSRQVAGLQIGTALAVGSDLAALCHELAHLAKSLEGDAQENHAGWALDGTLAAIDVYGQWLFQTQQGGKIW